jgi:glycosyltransferase involved in cell wall biosynthesis
MLQKTQKVALLISTLGGGGAERVCVIIANGLVDRGWDVDLVILKKLENDRAASLSTGVNLICLGLQRARYAARSLRQYLRKVRPDVVLTFNNEMVVAEFFASFARKRDYYLVHRNVTTLSSILFHAGGGLRNQIRYWFIKKVLLRVDLVVNQCKGMAKDTGRELSLKQSSFIYNPAGRDLNVPILERSPSTPIILCIGRIDRNKCIELALQALALLSDYPETEIWIVGEGEEKENVEKFAEKLRLSSRVKFLGFQRDPEQLYKMASLVSLTSNFEGFPNVLVEAISHGCPIVAVDCPNGPSEIVVEGVNGFLVQQRTAESLASGYAKALEKDWDPKRIVETADKFSDRKVLDQWHGILAKGLKYGSNQ